MSNIYLIIIFVVIDKVSLIFKCFFFKFVMVVYMLDFCNLSELCKLFFLKFVIVYNSVFLIGFVVLIFF